MEQPATVIDITSSHQRSSLLNKAILSVRGLFAATGHSFQDTAFWLDLFDPKN